MEHFVFQNWITLAGSGTAPVVQEAKDWVGFASFSDIVFYLDIASLVMSPAIGLIWSFQTAPTKDEKLFKTMTSYTVSSSPNQLQVLPVTTGVSTPLATWVRWQIAPSGGTTSWSTTFRVLVAANRVSRGLG